MADQTTQREYRRRGDTAKCPACGVSMDSEAYRCPKCRIYFCFKCRRRVQARDAQFQCMNQQCGYYGKLLCGACIIEMPQSGERTRRFLVEDVFEPYIPGSFSWACLTIALFVVVAAYSGMLGNVPYSAPILILALLGVVISVCLLYSSSTYGTASTRETELDGEYYKMGDPFVGTSRIKEVAETVEVGRSKCCMACRRPVENLS